MLNLNNIAYLNWPCMLTTPFLEIALRKIFFELCNHRGPIKKITSNIRKYMYSIIFTLSLSYCLSFD